ncbi:MAG TPA: DUF4350 domain-containing protein [Mycobacterium sp.]|nr:DUF4350 domain-containing protein [Mycobacterium sp.]
MTAVLDRPKPAPRWRSGRWVALGLVAIVVVAMLSAYLLAPRPGGRMDPDATGPDGAHALVSLLRDRGVEVVVANSVADVEHAARPDALVLVAETGRIAGSDLLQRLARVPGDRLLVQPTSRARTALAPAIRTGGPGAFTHEPDCDLPEADRAGTVDLHAPQTYVAADGQSVHSCYHGALVRYRSGGRVVTVVGNPSFMTNSGLLAEGNAALAMNLAGARPRLVWYAPQSVEGQRSSTATVSELIPPNVGWLAGQLWLAVALAALWKSRRIGPLVAEQLPVVVRASETIEGLGRLYRSRRARDRAAQALRTALLRRLMPRLGLGVAAPSAAVVTAIAGRTGAHPEWLWQVLFGAPPRSDTELLQFARALDAIERQVMRP